MLERAIRSALNQTFPDLQVCVFDNGSGDETGAVVARLAREDARVKYFCQAENVGLINNFNTAMQRVETPYFSFLCDDDMLLPRFYETVLCGFAEHPHAGASAARILFAAQDGSFATAGAFMEREGCFEPPYGLRAWTHDARPLITGILFKRDVLDVVPKLAHPLLGDLDMELRVAAHFPYVISFEPGAIITSHAAQNTKHDERVLNEWQVGFDLIRCHLEAIAPEILPRDVLRDALNGLHEQFGGYIFRLGMVALARGQFEQVREMAAHLRAVYRREKEAALLERLSGLSKTVPPLHWGYRALHGLRVQRKQWQTRALRAEIRPHLEMPPAP